MKRRRFLVLFLVAVAALATCALASAGPPTDTPAPAPTVPRYSSAIATTYTYKGIPFMAVVNHLHIAYVNGEFCSRITSGDVRETITQGAPWPWVSRRPCNELGATVRVCDLFERCTSDFLYTGQDVSLDTAVPVVPEIATVTTHFVREGAAQPVTLLAWGFAVGNAGCGGGDTLPVILTKVTRWWPSLGPCAVEGADVSVRLVTEEFGELRTTFQWNGTDVNYEVEIKTATTPSPSPPRTPIATGSTPTPATPTVALTDTQTPSALPNSGGPPPGERFPALPAVVGLAAAVATIVSWRIAAHRRKS